ncbi:hypothetical protein TRAPUB_3629 [Trametes pubescens]|uniref:Endonuclease/exonuclease/phosphatase domain-containing protein n=1 Tax=Trametes pubescens TaxID=154538 RepID=A0A1M2VD64_TRAPU|nr:hypothetical protein TRAPUB_3629 [Trametes pubescens]
MLEPSYRETLAQWDVLLLQETHLRPGQEDQIELPRGFQCMALSREAASDFGSQGGGLFAIFRDTVPVINVTPTAESEIMLLRVGDILLANIYLPPASSPWVAHMQQCPVEHLLECLQPALAHDVLVLLIGDFNARIGNRGAALPRLSPDETMSTRGRALLQRCTDLSLQVVNGTTFQDAGTIGRRTSFQPGGSSVIDLALVSSSLLRTDNSPAAISAFEVCEYAEGWSDHAALSLTLRVPDTLLLP